MNVHLTSRQTQLTPDIKDFCEKRLAALEKLLGFVTDVDLILSSGKNRHKAEIHIKAKGAGLVLVEESRDMMNSLNMVFDSLEKKIKKERAKYREKKTERESRTERVFPSGGGRSGRARDKNHPFRLFFGQTAEPRGSRDRVRPQAQGSPALPDANLGDMGGSFSPQGRQLRSRPAGMRIPVPDHSSPPAKKWAVFAPARKEDDVRW